MKFRSQLYVGSVMHRRFFPRPHHFRYAVFWLLIDLDELEGLSRTLRWFSHNRFNLFSLYDRDHGDGSRVALRDQVHLRLRQAGIEAAQIRLLCMPRTLGYAFDPLSVYFCYRADGTLTALLHEVHNTSGERHSYLLPVSDQTDPIRQSCRKAFYVSPFLDMDLSYDFRISGPNERIVVGINVSSAKGSVLAAALSGERRALSDRSLLRVFFSTPAVTMKVIGAIHWQALKLWQKGIGIRQRPRTETHAPMAWTKFGPTPSGP